MPNRAAFVGPIGPAALDPIEVTSRASAGRVIARAPILRSLEPRALADVRRTARIRVVPPGGSLAAETSGTEQPSLWAGQTLHVIVRGWCKAVRSDPDGSAVVVDVRGPGEIACLERLAFAWEPVPSSGPRAGFAAWIALGPVEVVSLPGDRLRWAIERSPAAFAEMQSMVGSRLLELERASLVAVRPTAERLLRTLRGLARRFGTPVDRGRTVEVPITQGDIAAMIGATRETTNRALRRLAAAGDVVLDEGRPVLVRWREGASDGET